MKKVIFFDVDGTLVNFNGTMPQSNVDALRCLKEKGHYIYVCTGRSRFSLTQNLIDINFDGIIGAAGAYVECEGKEVFQHTMEENIVSRVLKLAKEEDWVYSLQTKEEILMTERSFKRLVDYLVETKGMTEAQIKKNPLFIDFLKKGIDEEFEHYKNQVEKIVYRESRSSMQQIREILGDGIEVTKMSFEGADDFSGEISTAGVNKALGIQKVLDYYGKKKEDAIAFGDGPNDIEMIEFVGLGIAMGNAVEEVKQKADKITGAVDQDGIFNALEELNLI